MNDREFFGALQVFERALQAAAADFIAGQGTREAFEYKLDAIREAFESAAAPLPQWSELDKHLRKVMHHFYYACLSHAHRRAWAEYDAKRATLPRNANG